MSQSHQYFNNLDGVTQKYGFTKVLEMDDDGKFEKQCNLIARKSWDVPRSITSGHSASTLGCIKEHETADIAAFNDLFYFDMKLPFFQSCEDEEITKLQVDAAAFRKPELNNNIEGFEAKRKRPYAASLHILKNYRKRFRKLNRHKIQKASYKDCSLIAGEKLSTGAILRLAAERFIQFSSDSDHTDHQSFVAGFSHGDTNKDVQLVQFLLAAAEKVGSKQFQFAKELLLECDKGSSDQGDPIERLVYYFSGALQERIDRETGTISPKGLGSKQCRDILEAMRVVTPDKMAMQKNVPFSQVTQLAGIQAILDHITDSTKIHIVDLEIRSGMHYTILMQALATRFVNPVEYLKITAIGTKSRAQIEKTRDRLINFARTLNMNLYFNVVMVDKITDLDETLLEIKPDEAVAVWIEYFLMFYLCRQDILESLMGFVRGLNPRIMILTDVEGNTNSPVFVARFIESLFHYGGFFDCLAECLKHDPANRKAVEYGYLSQAIRNIVATEGEERTIRHVPVHIWRSFFARFGLFQAELSMSSIYQANLVRENFASGKSCTLHMDGKCLIVGWKGSPIHSLSAWKENKGDNVKIEQLSSVSNELALPSYDDFNFRTAIKLHELHSFSDILRSIILMNSSKISHLGEVNSVKANLPLQQPLELLKVFEAQIRCLKRRKPANEQTASSDSSKIAIIFEIARKSLAHHAADKLPDLSILGKNLGLPSESLEDFELAFLLQASAENVAQKEYDHARKMLKMFSDTVSMYGNPLQRIGYYFAEALAKKIEQETGIQLQPERFSEHKGLPVNSEQLLMRMQTAMIGTAQELPFSQIIKFAGVQAILDTVASAKRIHLIDFQIKCGSHWTIFMQGLADRQKCPVKLLRITAVGSSEKMLNETGKWLSSFAENKNLPFSFKTIVSDLKDLKGSSFELNSGEVVAVFADKRFCSLLLRPNHLESLLLEIKKLKPRIMVMTEAEANTCAPNFMDRFNEILSFCIPLFDCLEDCMKGENEFRSLSEGGYMREMINNIITKEGEERVHRHQRIKDWRKIFARLNIREAELSKSSLYQAKLMLDRSPRWSSCTLTMDGKCLLMGWNGNPALSLSAWKFRHT